MQPGLWRFFLVLALPVLHYKNLQRQDAFALFDGFPTRPAAGDGALVGMRPAPPAAYPLEVAILVDHLFIQDLLGGHRRCLLLFSRSSSARSPTPPRSWTE